MNGFPVESLIPQSSAPCYRERWPVITCPAKRAGFNTRLNLAASGGRANDFRGLRIVAFIVIGLVICVAAAVILVAGGKMFRKAMQHRQDQENL